MWLALKEWPELATILISLFIELRRLLRPQIKPARVVKRDPPPHPKNSEGK
jgi:hypothetical protein